MLCYVRLYYVCIYIYIDIDNDIDVDIGIVWPYHVIMIFP